MRATGLALTIILGMAGTAAAADSSEEPDTGKLLRSCRLIDGIANKRSDDSGAFTEVGYCLGYLRGLLDSFEIADEFAKAQSLPKEPYKVFCPPQQLSTGQALAVFVKWATGHPEQWQVPSGIGVLTAFEEAWPCKR